MQSGISKSLIRKNFNLIKSPPKPAWIKIKLKNKEISSTKNIISKNEFLKMKKNCVVINTSRGGIINERDLFWALKNNKIHGAGIDVYETEPPETNNPLFKLDNIVLSPHNAALTLECRKRMSIETCENIINYLENKSSLNLNNIINKEKINLDI